ncbi:hypothetical protein LG331_15185 [Vreelandella aquamarina]|uniref:hypothetical protein n=1 Tax=Vreelandella aquamarina TaxID=77097 RepID=UPI00384B5169
MDLSGVFGTALSDDKCSQSDGTTYATTSPAVASHLFSGGSVRTNGGACSVTTRGVNADCAPETNGNFYCSFDIVSTSTGEASSPSTGVQGGLVQSPIPPEDYPLPSALTALPGGCSDPSSCVTIDDTSYLVDWDNVPEWFSYVGSDGVTYSKPQPAPTDPGDGNDGGSDGGGDVGGGCFTNCYPDDGSGGSDGGNDSGGSTGGGSSGGSGDDDSGNDSGGSTGGGSSGGGSTGGGSSGGGGSTGGGGSSGGGSTVPDFEFDESSIIEAVRSSGQSNRDSIDALSNDVTGAINNQTNELNTSTTQQTEALTSALGSETGRVTTAITSQTQSIQNTLDNQTRGLRETLEGMQNALVDAFGDIKVTFSGGGGSGGGSSDGEGEDGEGEGLDGFFDGLVDKLASRFTEEVGEGNDLFNSSGMDQTLDGLGEEQQGYNDEVNTLMDEIGDGSSSGIADQITSRLPSLPSGSCQPLKFGVMEISCQAFNTIQSWLTWIIYFWTVVSVIETFFRTGQRTA